MRAAAAALAGALVAAVPGVAQAAPPVQHERTSQTWSDVFDFCGFAIRVDALEEGHLLVREVKGSQGRAYLAHENYRDQYVFTNVVTEQTFEIRGSGLFKEMRGRERKDIGENVWEFTAMDVGRTFTVLDSSGRTVLRNQGRVTLRVLFDVGDDHAPGGELLDVEVLGASGKHPAGLDPLEGFCDIATSLIGSAGD